VFGTISVNEEASMSEPTTVTTEVEPEPVFVPDYSRVSFKNLQRLCKLRGIPGDGNTVALVEKLRAYDVERGLSCDLSALDDSDPDVDLLGDLDAPVSTEHPHAGPAVLRTPAGGGEAASAPPPAGITARPPWLPRFRSGSPRCGAVSRT
jgi:hypothetical protein